MKKKKIIFPLININEKLWDVTNNRYSHNINNLYGYNLDNLDEDLDFIKFPNSQIHKEKTNITLIKNLSIENKYGYNDINNFLNENNNSTKNLNLNKHTSRSSPSVNKLEDNYIFENDNVNYIQKIGKVSNNSMNSNRKKNIKKIFPQYFSSDITNKTNDNKSFIEDYLENKNKNKISNYSKDYFNYNYPSNKYILADSKNNSYKIMNYNFIGNNKFPRHFDDYKSKIDFLNKKEENINPMFYNLNKEIFSKKNYKTKSNINLYDKSLNLSLDCHFYENSDNLNINKSKKSSEAQYSFDSIRKYNRENNTKIESFEKNNNYEDFRKIKNEKKFKNYNNSIALSLLNESDNSSNEEKLIGNKLHNSSNSFSKKFEINYANNLNKKNHLLKDIDLTNTDESDLAIDNDDLSFKKRKYVNEILNNKKKFIFKNYKNDDSDEKRNYTTNLNNSFKKTNTKNKNESKFFNKYIDDIEILKSKSSFISNLFESKANNIYDDIPIKKLENKQSILNSGTFNKAVKNEFYSCYEKQEKKITFEKKTENDLHGKNNYDINSNTDKYDLKLSNSKKILVELNEKIINLDDIKFVNKKKNLNDFSLNNNSNKYNFQNNQVIDLIQDSPLKAFNNKHQIINLIDNESSIEKDNNKKLNKKINKITNENYRNHKEIITRRSPIDKQLLELDFIPFKKEEQNNNKIETNVCTNIENNQQNKIFHSPRSKYLKKLTFKRYFETNDIIRNIDEKIQNNQDYEENEMLNLQYQDELYRMKNNFEKNSKNYLSNENTLKNCDFNSSSDKNMCDCINIDNNTNDNLDEMLLKIIPSDILINNSISTDKIDKENKHSNNYFSIKNKCLRCNKPNHISDCWKNKEDGICKEDISVICKNCGNLNHEEEDCLIDNPYRLKNKENLFKNDICLFCGEKGHALCPVNLKVLEENDFCKYNISDFELSDSSFEKEKIKVVEKPVKKEPEKDKDIDTRIFI